MRTGSRLLGDWAPELRLPLSGTREGRGVSLLPSLFWGPHHVDVRDERSPPTTGKSAMPFPEKSLTTDSLPNMLAIFGRPAPPMRGNVAKRERGRLLVLYAHQEPRFAPKPVI